MGFHILKNACVKCHLRTQSLLQSRFVSGYKLSVENYEKLRKTRKENVKSEYSKFREKVDLSVIKKSRPPLKGFEVVTHYEIKNTTGENWNEKYKNRVDLPKYNGWNRYYKAAENVRRQLKQQDHWWKSFDKVVQDTCGDKTGYQDISLSSETTSQSDLREELIAKRNETELERSSRNQTLEIDFNLAMDAWETSKQGKTAIKTLYHYFGVYKDLFVDKDFLPNVQMEVGYEDLSDNESVNPVYYGNVLSPTDASKQPLVSFKSDCNDLWTIALVNPDGHLEDNDKEYLHWMVGNIPGNDIESGKVLMDYLQPFPCDGTGYHRMIFLLFKQKENISFDQFTQNLPCTNLRERNFSTQDFYEKYHEVLTPASVRFFQCKWDISVKHIFHKIFDIEEPVYVWENELKLPRIEKLYEYPDEMTYEYLEAFQPVEPVYPDGSTEATEIIRKSVIRATKVLSNN